MRERVELDRRDRAFRGDRQPPILHGRTVILVDDGLATGSTMQAAILAVRQSAPARIVVAVPVGARETCARLRRIADEVVCAATPEPFTAVGLWYESSRRPPTKKLSGSLPHDERGRRRIARRAGADLRTGRRRAPAGTTSAR